MANPRPHNRRNTQPTQRRRSAAAHKTPSTISAGQTPQENNARVLLTRRNLLLGAAGVGVAAAAGAGVKTFMDAQAEAKAIHTLSVPKSNVATIDDFAEIELSKAFSLESNFSLPFGSLVFCTDDTYACCLLPNELPSPLVEVVLLNLATGSRETVLANSVGANEGFEVYDARATSRGIIWLEANIFAGQWRIYAAPFARTGEGVSNPQMLDSGDSSIQIPSLAAVDKYCFWTVMPPSTASNATKGPALLKGAVFSSSTAETYYEGRGRMACAVYSAHDGVVITPRHPESTRYFQLLHINAESGKVTDEVTLPAGMKPSDVGWGSKNGFAFAFDGIYNYGDGIANLGTYTPLAWNGSYSNSKWFRFGRTPLAAPSWCGDDWFVVKSSTVVCAIDFKNGAFVSFGSLSGATSWGDYLASSGQRSNVVTYATIDQNKLDGTVQKEVLVRVFAPHTSSSDAASNQNA